MSVLPLLLSNPVWLHLSAQVQGSVCLLLGVATAARRMRSWRLVSWCVCSTPACGAAACAAYAARWDPQHESEQLHGLWQVCQCTAALLLLLLQGIGS